MGNGSAVVISDGFEVIGFRKKSPLVWGKARIVLGQAEKFDLNAFMTFEHLAGALEDNGLRGVKCGELSGSPCIVVKTRRKHGLAPLKMVIGVLQKAFRFRGHRSRPSCRISCMSGERSP